MNNITDNELDMIISEEAINILSDTLDEAVNAKQAFRLSTKYTNLDGVIADKSVSVGKTVVLNLTGLICFVFGGLGLFGVWTNKKKFAWYKRILMSDENINRKLNKIIDLINTPWDKSENKEKKAEIKALYKDVVNDARVLLKNTKNRYKDDNSSKNYQSATAITESIMHKDGMELLVEESVIEQEFETEKTETETSIAQNIDKTDENSKSDIIELRNLPELSCLRDVNTFVGNAMRGLGSMLLAKSAHFSSAYRELLKINLVCGTEYTLGDLFENYSIIKKECGGPDTYCDEHKIEYSKINLDIVNQYRAKIENMANAAYDCLFGDLYDKDVLHKYLPILCFAAY